MNSLQRSRTRIITGHRHSPILALNVGQLDSYRAVALSGTACIVQF
jgi:hypothetical protein